MRRVRSPGPWPGAGSSRASIARDGPNASPASAAFSALLQGFPDASVEISEQLAERDLVATRKTLRGTHLGEL